LHAREHGFDLMEPEREAHLFMPHIGGVGRYRKICEEIVAEGYKGFRFQAKSAAPGRRRAI
jgi:cyclohexanone monooxygenase